MIASRTRYMTSFEEKVNQRLVDTGITMQVLAEKVGLPLPELHALCEGNNPRLSEMEQLGQALRIDPIYFMPPVRQNGSFNQAGNGNTLKIKIGKAAAHALAAELAICRRVLDMSIELIAAKDALITAKQESLEILKSATNLPN